jgi:hypothetical protein
MITLFVLNLRQVSDGKVVKKKNIQTQSIGILTDLFNVPFCPRPHQPGDVVTIQPFRSGFTPKVEF